jgi:hypothetical protein
MNKPLPLVISFLAFSLCLMVWSCKKDLSVESDGSGIDPNLVAAWYNPIDTVGFEAKADGSTKTLIVDAAGRLQYMPAQDTLKRGTMIFTILKTGGSEISLRLTYRITHVIDTTISVAGEYHLSAFKDTLYLSIPDPNTSEPIDLMYDRSSIGAQVVTRR